MIPVASIATLQSYTNMNPMPQYCTLRPLGLKQRFLPLLMTMGALLGSVFFASPIQAQDLPPTKPRQYKLGPDSTRDQDAPQGKVTEHEWLESKVFPGTKRRYSVYVPQQYDPQKPAALMVFQDGHAYVSDTGQYRACVVMDNLIHRGEMPVTIGIFIDPGHKKDALPEKRGWRPRPENRSVEYDTLSDDYARFLVDEIIPEVQKNYNLTDDPAGWGICGASSGGICAFTVAWERPDKFRKVISHIGSFTNIRHGDTYPGIIRKTDPKPIRIYLQDGSNDLDNEHGNWPLGNQQMYAALKFKAYDVKFDYGEGAHNGNHGGYLLPDAMRWTWRDYPNVQPKLSMIPVPQDAKWAIKWWMPRHQSKLAQRKVNPDVDLLLVGDSITHGWEGGGKEVFDKAFAKFNVLNIGFSGDRTEHVVWRIQNGAIDDIQPKAAVIMIGTNNTGHRMEKAAHTADGVMRVVDEIKLRLPETKILLLAIFPRGEKPDHKMRRLNDSINERIRAAAQQTDNVWFADINQVFLDKEGKLPKSIMPDLLHPNAKGYQLWADAMMPKLEELMQ